MGQIKLRFSFWLKINFRKMASHKHVDLRKKENFIRSKCYLEDMHWVKSVQIRSYFWSVFFRIRSEYREIRNISVFTPHSGKYGPEITPYLDTFHAVISKDNGKKANFRQSCFRWWAFSIQLRKKGYIWQW